MWYHMNSLKCLQFLLLFKIYGDTTLVSVPSPTPQKKDNLLLYLDILINTKLTWNKELAIITQRLHHSSATTVPSAFQTYFKCLLFSISNAISSVQDSVIPYLEYCNHLVYAYFIHSTCVGWVSGIIRPWTRTEQDWAGLLPRSLREEQWKQRARCGTRCVLSQGHWFRSLARVAGKRRWH